MPEIRVARRADGRILRAVERICPFLALQSDGHTVVAGYDAEHRCGALHPHEPLDRAQQLGTCLEAAHTGCPRYLAAMQARAERMPWAPPSPDAELLSTRLVLAPDAARHAFKSAGARARTRRWGVGAALAVVGVVAVAGGVLGALGSLGSGSPTPDFGAATRTASAQPSPMTAAPAIGGRPLPSAPVATAEGTPRPIGTSSATPPSRAPTEPSKAAPRTYVVREGDTLSDIANAFGTRVTALQAANDLADSDVIVIGQELVIP